MLDPDAEGLRQALLEVAANSPDARMRAFFAALANGNYWPPPAPPDQLLKRREVLDLLRLSAATLRRLVRHGLVPQPVRVGNGLRWKRSDIEAFLAPVPA
jgi:predicted DNA-binding transcriptional regulator AlpA